MKTKVAIPKHLDYLNLEQPKSWGLPKNIRISLLIRSLKDNYFSYGRMIALDESKVILRSQKNYNAGFFALPRIPLPFMKKGAPYILWENFTQQVFNFFDGRNRQAFISELNCLEEKLLDLYSLNDNLSANEEKSNDAIEMQLLEKIISTFEEASGFLKLVAINAQDGNNGILSREDFKQILQNGHPINDFGASIQHGWISHRLQFYLLGQHIKNNLHKYFIEGQLDQLLINLAHKYPNLNNMENKFPSYKIISVFYRLLGTKEFNCSFEWKKFIEEREKLNLFYNEGSNCISGPKPS